MSELPHLPLLSDAKPHKVQNLEEVVCIFSSERAASEDDTKGEDGTRLEGEQQLIVFVFVCGQLKIQMQIS